MDWLRVATRTAANFIDRIPFEKMLVRPRDTTKDREELRSILKGTPFVKDKEKTPPEPEHSIVLVRKSHSPGPTTEETVEYQNREIGKILYQIKKHAVQGFRISGKACDCGMKHMQLELEGDCEETIPMVSDPSVYMHILAWIEEWGPKSTLEAVETGTYAAEYPLMAHQARDLIKELMGTEDVSALFPDRKGKSNLFPLRKKLELPPANEVKEIPATVTPETQT